MAILATVDTTGPAAIPVSALVRVDGRTLLLALAHQRASLARAVADPRAGISVLGPGFSACARGRVSVAADPLPGAEFMAALRFSCQELWDARGAATEVDAGIAWRWTDEEAAERHGQVLVALRALAAALPTEDPG